MCPWNPAAVNHEIEFELPENPDWSPGRSLIPEYLHESSSYNPSDPERLRWKSLQLLYPEGRRAKIAKCGKHALHLVKTGASGSYETVQPVGCSDKTACPYCAAKYASEQVLERLLKLGQICTAHKAALAVIEARVVLPAWNAAVRAQGCAQSEDRGRLCPRGCHFCDQARPHHARAAGLESKLQHALVGAWLKQAPNSGGCYHTNLETTAHGDITLVVRLFVPAVAVFDGAKVEWAAPDVQELEAAWAKTCAGLGARHFSLSTGHASSPEEIIGVLTTGHAPAMGQLERLAVEGVVTQNVVRTFARAVGLSVVGESGKVRRVQRTAWFGTLAGRNQAATLAVLKCEIRRPTPEAVQAIKDRYLVLQLTPEYVEVQSVYTGERKTLPRKLWKQSHVDHNGNPLTPPEMAAWEFVTGQNYAAELIRYAKLLDSRGIMQVVQPRNKREYQRAQLDVLGASMGFEYTEPMSRAEARALWASVA